MTTPAKIEPWVKKLAQHVMMVLAHNTPHGPTEYEQALKVISSIIADDIAALEAENERLLEERQRLLAWLEIKKDEGLARPVYSAVKAELRAILNREQEKL